MMISISFSFATILPLEPKCFDFPEVFSQAGDSGQGAGDRLHVTGERLTFSGFVMVSVLLSALVERFSVSCMHDFH